MQARARARGAPARAAGAAAAAALAGCRGVQSALDPAGPHARAIAEVWWVMAAGAAAILALVTALALYAVYRDPARRARIDPRWMIALGGVAFPVVALSALLAWGIPVSGRQVGAEPSVWSSADMCLAPVPGRRVAVQDRGLRIEIVAHQFRWEVRHLGGGAPVVTTNELRLPAGVRVPVTVTSADVIHSFWVPPLGGKLDAIPGRVHRGVLLADRPGEYRGQCAEFCGIQHAHMVLRVRVETPEAFAAWLDAESAAGIAGDRRASR